MCTGEEGALGARGGSDQQRAGAAVGVGEWHIVIMGWRRRLLAALWLALTLLLRLPLLLIFARLKQGKPD